MNLFVPDSFAESVHRLALGIEPRESQLGGRLPFPVRVELEPPLGRGRPDERDPFRRIQHRGDPVPTLSRNDSCRHVLLYHPALAEGRPVAFRIFDHFRRYVPRRFELDLVSLETAEAQPAADRLRQPALFPGAAYDVSDQATGLRGRVVRGDGSPVRWTRITASRNGQTVGRAQGDDRGEFLLLITSAATEEPEFESDILSLDLTVSHESPQPTEDFPGQAATDPLWDLPLEGPLQQEADDPVGAGFTLPSGYVSEAPIPVEFELGRLLSDFSVTV